MGTLNVKLTFQLPLPPSLNNLYPTVTKRGGGAGLAAGNRISREAYREAVLGEKPKTRRIKSQKYKDWIKAADGMLLTQKANIRGRTIGGKWGVMIFAPLDTPDLDNRIKPILDFCVRVGLTSDDRHARRIAIEEHEDIPAGECRVWLMRI